VIVDAHHKNILLFAGKARHMALLAGRSSHGRLGRHKHPQDHLPFFRCHAPMQARLHVPTPPFLDCQSKCPVYVPGRIRRARFPLSGSRYTLTLSAIRYIIITVLKTFATKDTYALFLKEKVKQLPPDIFEVAYRKLHQLNRVIFVDELREPPGNRLKKLSGNRNNQWSIRINNQWRICFRFEAGNAFDVEIVDYH